VLVEEAHPVEISTIRDYLAVLRRHAWVVLLPIVLVPLAAVFLSLRQQSLYKASAQVFLKQQNLAATLAGVPDYSVFQDPATFAQTQVDLAQAPTVERRTVKAVGRPGDIALLARSSVTASANGDLLTFAVTLPDRALAPKLATAYARQYTLYRHELDTASVTRARKQLATRLASLRASGDEGTQFYKSLLSKDQQLETLQTLQTANAFVLRSASGAAQVQPRPVRYGILGLGIGVLLGIGLAFFLHALDTRIRSTSELSTRLGLPLLARIPAPSRRGRDDWSPAMLADPSGGQAEAFRMLRTALEFANLERHARTIMLTSAVESEGKSTTAVNLALALARRGLRVALLDLDLRRPAIARFFGLSEQPGVAEVALGHALLDEALRPIAIQSVDGAAPTNDGGRGTMQGVLNVLTAGPTPPDPGEFVETSVVGDVLAELADRFDIVLVDAPPLLHVNDALALSAKVDGLMLVARLSSLRRPMLAEIERVLTACPSAKLGLVVTGTEADEHYGYGTYRYSGYRSSRRKARAAAPGGSQRDG
jgi:succinoglycan biosynthesis transport protein ExoP